MVYSEKKLLWVYARNPYIHFLLCLMCVQVLKRLPEKTKQFNYQICFYATFSLKDGQIYPNRNIIPWLHPCLCQRNHCRASTNGHSPCLTSSRFPKLQRTIKQPRWRWFFFSQLFSFQHWINNVNPFWVTAPCIFFFPFSFLGHIQAIAVLMPGRCQWLTPRSAPATLRAVGVWHLRCVAATRSSALHIHQPVSPHRRPIHN